MNHLAIICDGNRRWARSNRLPIEAGYVQGLTVVEGCCKWAIKNAVRYLTVYLFSTENWSRPTNEVDALKSLGRLYFGGRLGWYVSNGIRVRFSGRRDRFEPDLIEIIDSIETATSECESLDLIICIDYGGRDEIVRSIESGAKTEEEITAHLTRYAPEPDAILRTGGDMRLSNFLLWQSAYAELMFVDDLFPDLDDSILDQVLHEYHTRKRNFGK
jgi:undecaprenyl diphosphate synthase